MHDELRELAEIRSRLEKLSPLALEYLKSMIIPLEEDRRQRPPVKPIQPQQRVQPLTAEAIQPLVHELTAEAIPAFLRNSPSDRRT